MPHASASSLPASILDLFSLHGRTALVTGASRGLGAIMAEALAKAGADVILVARFQCESVRFQLIF